MSGRLLVSGSTVTMYCAHADVYSVDSDAASQGADWKCRTWNCRTCKCRTWICNTWQMSYENILHYSAVCIF